MIARTLCFLLAVTSLSFSGIITKAQYRSTLLGRRINYSVVVPDDYSDAVSDGKRYPVLYLLHPKTGKHTIYYSAGYSPDVDSIVDSVGYIFAIPNCGDNWWLDSPVNANSAYSSFLVDEFKPLIDSLYATLPDRQNTGIAGHSMGGFGAMHNAIEHPETYGSAFSMKGALDPRLPLNEGWREDAFGFYDVLGTDTTEWDRVNVLKNIYTLRDKGTKLGHFTGTRDQFFHSENQRFDSILTSLSIPHVYWEANDNHFNIDRESFIRVIEFFDTAFVYTSSETFAYYPPVPPNTRQHEKSHVSVFSIHGRYTGSGSSDGTGVSLLAPGIYVELSSGNKTRLLLNPAK